jgi:hypothetical protein
MRIRAYKEHEHIQIPREDRRPVRDIRNHKGALDTGNSASWDKELTKVYIPEARS